MIESLGPRGAEEAGLGGHGIEHQHVVFAALAILFAALVAGLALWLRRAARASEIEEIDRMLDEE